MLTLEPGVCLRCIESDIVQDGSTVYEIVRDRVYTCREVFDPPSDWTCNLHGAGCSGRGLQVVESPLPEGAGWCTASFEPIYRPSIDWEAFRTAKLPYTDADLPPNVRRVPGADA